MIGHNTSVDSLQLSFSSRALLLSLQACCLGIYVSFRLGQFYAIAFYALHFWLVSECSNCISAMLTFVVFFVICTCNSVFFHEMKWKRICTRAINILRIFFNEMYFFCFRSIDRENGKWLNWIVETNVYHGNFARSHKIGTNSSFRFPFGQLNFCSCACNFPYQF